MFFAIKFKNSLQTYKLSLNFKEGAVQQEPVTGRLENSIFIIGIH
jgi:hypothetical protein